MSGDWSGHASQVTRRSIVRKFNQLIKVTVSLYTLFILPTSFHCTFSSETIVLMVSELNRKVLKSFLTLRRFFAVYNPALRDRTTAIQRYNIFGSVEECKEKI